MGYGVPRQHPSPPARYELKTGERHRNAEFITVRGGKLVETQMLFGGRV